MDRLSGGIAWGPLMEPRASTLFLLVLSPASPSAVAVVGLKIFESELEDKHVTHI